VAERLGKGRRAIPPKLYRVGELVEYAGVSRQTIHNYAVMGLLPESRWSKGGHRLFDEDVFDRLELIGRLRGRNRSMQYIRGYFRRLDGQEGPR